MAVFRAIDAGNSCIKVASFIDGELKKVVALERDHLVHDREEFFAEAVAGLSDEPAADLGTVYVCGRPAEEPLVGELARQLAPGFEPRALQAEVSLPFKILYESGVPGPDRLANVLALRAHGRRKLACVVDIGTAVNLEFIDRDGDFCGGAILPGPKLQVRSLVEATRGRLPAVDSSEGRITAIGNSTDAAIRSGVYLGIAGAIDRIIDEAEVELGSPLRILCTGGDSGLVRGHLAHKFDFIPHLTLFGLREFGELAGH